MKGTFFFLNLYEKCIGRSFIALRLMVVANFMITFMFFNSYLIAFKYFF